MINLFDKKTKLIFLFIFLTELFSIFAYLLSDFQQAAFFIIVALVLVLSLIKLEYGILILLAELFIGSKGYLFYFDTTGAVISIRIALWLIVMAVWLGKLLAKWMGNRGFNPQAWGFNPHKHFKYFLPLFIFIVWGVINGFLNHNDFGNIFFDFLHHLSTDIYESHRQFLWQVLIWDNKNQQ